MYVLCCNEIEKEGRILGNLEFKTTNFDSFVKKHYSIELLVKKTMATTYILRFYLSKNNHEITLGITVCTIQLEFSTWNSYE